MSPECPKSAQKPDVDQSPSPSQSPSQSPRWKHPSFSPWLRHRAVWVVFTVCLTATAGAALLTGRFEPHRVGLAEAVLVVGSGFSALLAMMTHLLATGWERALSFAESSTSALLRSESKHRAIIERTPEGFAEVGGDGRLIAVNDALARALGYAPADLVGRHVGDLTEGAGRRTLLQQLALRKERDQRRYEVTLRCRDGHALRMRVNVCAWHDEEDGTLHSFALLTDITHDDRLDDAQRLAPAIIDSVRDGIMVTDLQRRILVVNPAFGVITGYTADEAVGASPSLLSTGRSGPDFYNEVWRTIGEQGYWQGDMWNRRKDGALFVTSTTIVPIRDETGCVSHFVDVLHDITHRKEDEDRAWHLANYDVLTGLPNRLLLQDRLSQALGHAQRSGHRFAVLYVDLDGFKPVNDRFGHAGGDELLQSAARRLQSCVRGSDTVARLGGDEFVVVLPDTAERAAAETVGRKILGELSTPYQLAEGKAETTASIGVAQFPHDARTVETLLDAADRAMYRAKSLGKNRIAFVGDLKTASAPENLRIDVVENP